MSRSKNRKIADLISGGTFDDGVVAASEVTGLHSVASTGNFNELSNKPAPFDPATLASVAVSGSFNDLSDQPTPFDPSTLATVATTGAYSALSGKPSLGTASTQATGAFATAAQGTKADAAVQPNTNPTFGTVSASSLTGIGSIDATTAAAIGAAGVGGGGWELLQETSITSDTSYIQYNFDSDYNQFLVNIEGVRAALGNRQVHMRLTNSSNTLLTSNNYQGSFDNESSGSVGGEFKPEFHCRDDLDAIRGSMWFHIFYPKDSNVQTSLRFWGFGIQSGTYAAKSGFGLYAGAQVHNGARFYVENNSFDSTTQGYRVWGIA